jgi:hypothetical protein
MPLTGVSMKDFAQNTHQCITKWNVSGVLVFEKTISVCIDVIYNLRYRYLTSMFNDFESCNRIFIRKI